MRVGCLVLVLVAGCTSFFSVRGPGSKGTDCTTSWEDPITDTVVAAALTAVAVMGYVRDARCEARATETGGEHLCFNSLYSVPAGAIAIVDSISMTYGYVTVDSCHHYRRDHAAEAR